MPEKRNTHARWNGQPLWMPLEPLWERDLAGVELVITYEEAKYVVIEARRNERQSKIKI